MNLIFNKLWKMLIEEFLFHYDQLELELAMNSREFLKLLVNIELNFKIEVTLDEIDNLMKEDKFHTIKDLVQYIETKELSKFINKN
jgi:acyl carrier protein